MSSIAPVSELQPETSPSAQPARGARRWWLIFPCAIAGLVLGMAPAYRAHLTAGGNPPQQQPAAAPTAATAAVANPLSAIEQAILDTQADERIQARDGNTAAYAAAQHREQLLELSFHGALASLSSSERATIEADLNRRELDAAHQAQSVLNPAPPVVSQETRSVVKPLLPQLLPGALAGASIGAILGAILALCLPRKKIRIELIPESAPPASLAVPLRHLGEIPDLTDFVTVGPYDPFQIVGFTLLLEEWTGKAPPDGMRSFAIASAHPGAGKTLIAANLAIALSRTELRVLLIDANLQHPAVHAQFELPNQTGLANLLAGKPDREAVAAAILPTLYPRLSILPAGRPGPQPNFPLFSQILSSLAGDFDLVLVDLPSLESAQSSLIAANCCQQTLLIVPAAEEAAAEEIRSTRQHLSARKIHLAGTILNHQPKT